MKQQRNVEGLRQNAQKKRQEAIERTEQGIKQLLKEGRVINFRTVAEVADVSTAWLYKQPEIKAQIEHLRRQRSKKEEVPIYQKASDASKDSLIRTLKERIKKLELENREQRKHIEVVQGIALQVTELNKQVSTLTNENLRLKQLLDQYSASSKVTQTEGHSSNSSPSSKQTFIHPPAIDNQLQVLLNELSVKINSTLSKLILVAPEETVQKAINSLKEARISYEVRNPCGFLVEAIKNNWIPGERYEHKVEMNAFNEWFPIAKSLRLVIASTQENGVLYVITQEQQLIPFDVIVSDYPLKKLQEMV